MPVISRPGRAPAATWDSPPATPVCRSLAADAGLADANLYRVWLSTSATDAYCHVAGFSGKKSDNCGQPNLPDAGPWERTDGVAFSHRLSDLTTTFDVLHPAYLDETGSPIQSGYDNTFTGTDANGALDDSALNCNNWQSGSSSDSALSGLLYLGAIGWTRSVTPIATSLCACSASIPEPDLRCRTIRR